MIRGVDEISSEKMGVRRCVPLPLVKYGATVPRKNKLRLMKHQTNDKSHKDIIIATAEL